jgi:hypothetical protein
MMEESRLDFLEGRVEEQSRNWDRLYGEIGRLDQKIDLVRSEISVRVDALGDKIDRHFMWLVGIQIGTLVAVIGALLRR